MPNKHSVYMHDTPYKRLFNQSQRAFSSGCIRVENPMELGERLLARQDWAPGKLQAEIANGRTQTVTLKQRIPVLIMYWTVHPQADGSVRFFPDIYNRDGPVLEALNDPAA